MPICPRGHESQAEDWCDFCGFPMTPPPGLAVPGSPFGPPATPPAPPSFGGHPQPTAGLVTCPICRTPQTGRYCEDCGYDYDLSMPTGQHRQITPPAPQPGGGYGYPPPAASGYPGAAAQPQPAPGHGRPVPSAFPEAALSQAGFPEPEGFGTSGPVYAQPMSAPPAPSGNDFGTSFRAHQPAHQPAEQPGRTSWLAVVSADREYFTEMMARSGPEAAGLFFPPYCPERRIPLTGRGQIRIGRRSQHRGTVPEIDLSVPPEDPGASHQHALLAEQPDGSWVLVDQNSTNGTTVNGAADPVPPHTEIPLSDGDRIHLGAWTTITLHHS